MLTVCFPHSWKSADGTLLSCLPVYLSVRTVHGENFPAQYLPCRFVDLEWIVLVRSRQTNIVLAWT